MKAIMCHGAKDLAVVDIDAPKASPNNILVRVAVGGICGSDLHYYRHGGFGTVRLKEPMILGHEISGHITHVGENIEGFTIGELVAVSPSRPCGNCMFCNEGKYNHCENMQFYGSAMPFPHIQGAFRDYIDVLPSQCASAEGLSASEAAVAEPFSVVLHALKQAGALVGKRVLVTGCGPIGALTVMAAKAAGAREIIVTDISQQALEFATTIGATHVINTAADPADFDQFAQGKGSFDVLFECSGAEIALRTAVTAMRPCSTIVQLGMGGDMNLPMQQITAKEIALKGSFRFHEEFQEAVHLMKNGWVDAKAIIERTFDAERAIEAFENAASPRDNRKTQIVFKL